MTRAARWAGAAAWWAMVALSLAWWVPSILAALLAWAAHRARSTAVSALVEALVALGRRDAARAVLRGELRRLEGLRRALEGRLR